MFLHSPHDMHEPLDRRWLRAGWLLENGLAPMPREDDAWVDQAFHFRSALARCRGEPDRLALAAAMPAVYEAHALHQAEPPLLRWAVEARILSGELFGDIARKCGLLADAVEAFEKLFFAVVDKLHAETWIVCQVIGMKAFVGMTEHDLGVWWKMLGHALGPLVLDIVVHGTTGLPRPQTATELNEALATAASDLLSLKEFHATHVLPVTPANALEILQVGAEMDVLHRQEQTHQQDPVAAFWTGVLHQRLATPVATVPGDRPPRVINVPPLRPDVEVLPSVREAV